MGKKKWKRMAQRRKLLLDGYKGMLDYYKRELAESREGERLLRGIGRAFGETVCDLCAEVQKKGEWSAAWKAIAKQYRVQVASEGKRIDFLLGAGDVRLERWRERVAELERMMQDGVGLSKHCGEPEGRKE